MNDFCIKKVGDNCCVNKPLLTIQLDHIILNQLHSILRITDVLIGNIIEDAMQARKKPTTAYISTGCKQRCTRTMERNHAVLIAIKLEETNI